MTKSTNKHSNSEQYFYTEHLKTNLKKQAVRGAGAMLFSRMLIYIIQTLGTIVLARILTPNDFGLIAMVTAFSLLLQNFGVNGFTEAVIQKDEIDHKLISTLFWINVGLNSGLAIIFALMAPFISSFYNEPKLTAIATTMSLSIIFGGLSTHHLALLKRNMKFYTTSLINIVAIIMSVILAITLAIQNWGYWALVVRRLTIPFVSAVGAWVMCSWRPGIPSKNSEIIPMLKFALNSYGNFSMTYFSRNFDKVLIGRFHGTETLGLYDKAFQFACLLPNQLKTPLVSVALATLSRLRDEKERFCKYFSTLLTVQAFIAMPLSAILLLIGKDIIILLLGPKWEAAGNIFSAFAPGAGMMILYGTHVWLHLSLGQANRLFRWSIIAFVIVACAFLISLPFGVTVMAVAYSLSYFLITGPALWYAGKPMNIKLSFFITTLWKICLAALLACGLSWLVLNSFEVTSTILLELNVFIRMFIISFLCIMLYLLFVIGFYRGLEPIKLFWSVFQDMIPEFKRKKAN